MNPPITNVKHPIYSTMRAHIPRERKRTHEWLKMEAKHMRKRDM
jgi:uncharacterized protein (UPF0216 family)